MSGKGDTPRPYSVSQGQYSSNWERTFGGRGKIYATCGHELVCLPTEDEITVMATYDRQGNRALAYPTLCLSCYEEAKAENLILTTPAEQEAWLNGLS